MATLVTSLFLLGCTSTDLSHGRELDTYLSLSCVDCLGPLLWAPISELVGRRPVFVGTMIIYCLFQLPSALGRNMTSVLIGRFLAGTFASAPLTNAGEFEVTL